jgi:hypothetical protein
MTIEGTVKQVMEPHGGTGKTGKQWSKCDFIITTGVEYPKDVCLTAWGDMVKSVQNLIEGQKVTAHIEISSRENSGRWYTEVKAWKIESAAAAVARPASETFATVQDDDLPF